MARCSICGHPEREAIDAALVAGIPLRTVAARYRVGKSALARHKEHIDRPATPTPATVRQRARPVADQVANGDQVPPCHSVDAPTPPCDNADVLTGELVADDDVPADEARLRATVRLSLAGRTQREIGARFGVGERTVRRWLHQARRERLDRFRSTSADDMLSSMLDRLTMLEAETIHVQDAATAAGTVKLALEALRQRRGLVRDLAIIGEKVGLWENYKFVPPADRDDPHAAIAERLRQGVTELVSLFLPAPDGTIPADVLDVPTPEAP